MEEEFMNSRKNRFISGFLSFVMMFALVMQVLPPIETSAISAEEGGEGKLTISSPSHGDEINGYYWLFTRESNGLFDKMNTFFNKTSNFDILIVKK